MNDKIIFPYYSGNIRLTKAIGHCSLTSFIKSHKTSKPHVFEILRKVKITKDPKQKRLLKHDLFSFTPSIYINRWDKRKIINIKHFTGLMQIDLDKINDDSLAKELKDYLFAQPETVTTYYSPSGDLKALIRIKICDSIKQFKAVHKAVTSKYEETGFFDEATKNAMLPLFLSHDSDILYRDYEEAETWIDEDNTEVKHTHLITEVQPQLQDSGYYYEKTIRILTASITGIQNNGHPQVRRAALIAGSRSGAGYIDRFTVQTIIRNLIVSNQYLSKGVQGYLDTAMWGIDQGYSNPKYYRE